MYYTPKSKQHANPASHSTPFSNNVGDYLPMIVQEQKAIKKTLLDFVDKNYLQLRDVQHASAEEVFYLINRSHQRVL